MDGSGFVILIGGASVLYGKLGKACATEQLAVISEEQSPAVEEQTGSEKQQETPEVQPEKDGLAESRKSRKSLKSLLKQRSHQKQSA